jgi:uncharacterized SAM-binding protein YcdF (DUF218 family)
MGAGKMSFRRRRQKRVRVALRLGALGIVAAIAWIVGLFGFAASIPSAVMDEASRNEGIIVLTGGSGRLQTGLRLLAEGKAKKLFVSGVYQGIDVSKLLEMSRHSPEELSCCVEIGHSAGNTAGNAAESAAWMRQQGYGSARIVTSSYHMPRSLLEFRHAMPKATLVPHPVFPEHVKQSRWWAWPGTAALIVGEYNKFILAWSRQAVFGVFSTDSKL